MYDFECLLKAKYALGHFDIFTKAVARQIIDKDDSVVPSHTIKDRFQSPVVQNVPEKRNLSWAFTLLALAWITLFQFLGYDAAAGDLSPKKQYNFTNLNDSSLLVKDLSRAKGILDYAYQQRGDVSALIGDFDHIIRKSDSLQLYALKYDALRLKGDCYILQNNIVKGQALYYEAINYYQKSGRLGEAADAWFVLGDNIDYSVDNSYDLKIRCFQSAEKLYMQLNKPLKVINCMKSVADVHLNQGKLNIAEQGLLEVLKQYASLKYGHLQETFDLLAYTARLQGDLKKQLYYRLKVVKYMEETRDFTNALFYYGALGKTYIDLKNYDRAGYYLEKAVAMPDSEKNYDYLSVYGNLIRNLIYQHKGQQAINRLFRLNTKSISPDIAHRMMIAQLYSDCYLELGENKNAERYQSTILGLCDRAHRSKFIPEELFFRSVKRSVEVYIKLKKFGLAERYAEWLQPIPHPNVVSPILVSESELDAFKIDSAFKRYKSAMNHFRNYVTLRDSLFNVSKTRQTDAMEYKLQSEQKDKSLQLQKKNILLLRGQAQLEHAKREHNMVKLNFTVIAAVILLLLLCVTYFGYNTKRLSNSLLQKKQLEIGDKNTELQHLLNENEWLLKEIHHRVKNNLQMITALLNSQSLYLKDPVALNAIMESQRRVQSMALIHQKLYKDSNYSSIFMPDYILELVTYLKQSFEGSKSTRLCLDIDPVSLDITNALPVGLIVNEAVTNTFKYAFPTAGDNWIEISLRESGKEAVLTVRDNGVGLPAGFNGAQNSFGTRLMRGLTDEMSGKFEMWEDSGTVVQVTFSPFVARRVKHSMKAV